MEAAGSRGNYATRSVQAAKCLKMPKILAEIKKLNEKADKKARNKTDHALMSVAARKARLSEIGQANSGALRGISLQGGQLLFDDESIKSAVSAHAQIIMIPDPEHDGTGPPPKIPAVMVDLQLHDPIKAIQELNKMDGVYKEGSLVPAEIHIHTGQRLEHDEQTRAQLKDPNLRVPIMGTPADQARYRKVSGKKPDPFAALAGKKV